MVPAARVRLESRGSDCVGRRRASRRLWSRLRYCSRIWKTLESASLKWRLCRGRLFLGNASLNLTIYFHLKARRFYLHPAHILQELCHGAFEVFDDSDLLDSNFC